MSYIQKKIFGPIDYNAKFQILNKILVGPIGPPFFPQNDVEHFCSWGKIFEYGLYLKKNGTRSNDGKLVWYFGLTAY